jgi:hypothetical protein
MEPVRTVGQGFFPLDEELALLPGSRLTPRQQEHLVHLASWMPFEQAGKMLACLLGVQVSEPTVRRQTEAAGALAQAVQTAQAQDTGPRVAQGQTVARLALSADGAYVPLLGGQWAEVRTVAIGEVLPQDKGQPAREVHVHHLSYFSRMTDAATFADLAQVETERWGVSQAQAVCAVTDGADWLQGFVDLHRPDAVRILDFAHAAEHVSALLQALQQAGMDLPADLLSRLLHRLKHRGPRLVLRLLDHLPAHLARQEGVQEHLGYLRKRAALMQYQDYRRAGWPLGSGMVESANKIVVEARLKGAGMHWHPTHVNPMLALRNGVCNDRWQEMWQACITEQFRRRRAQQQLRATLRYQQALSGCMLLLLRFLSPTSKPTIPSSRSLAPAATLPGSSRPSAHHPWKRGPACRPKSAAKT